MHHQQFYIDGRWVDPVGLKVLDVIDPSTEEAYTRIALGSKADVDQAVIAARNAFDQFSLASIDYRLALLRRVLASYNTRYDDLVTAVTQEIGAPINFAREAQVFAGRIHLESTIDALENMLFETIRNGTRVIREPIGVVGLITPWNWPLNQLICKIAPALAAGCTMVLKPSEIAPISAIILAEILDAACIPAGVFNLVNGTGEEVGTVISSHPDIDMVSFTGSTRAGILVTKAAADTVKRVSVELGGKSPNIILPDADLEAAVRGGVSACFGNSGQSCDAPTRMLVPRARHDHALEIAREAAEEHKVGNPLSPDTVLGPVASQLQFDKIQAMIQAGIDEGATLVAGGIGRPDNLNRGYYVRPTVFGNVMPEMQIAREEIFGPVLSVLSYDDEDQAVRIANDSPYGLAAYVQSGDLSHARRVARRLRAGTVQINYPDWDTRAPFGGYKQSGNGREYGEHGIAEFLETKAMLGYGN